MSQPSIERIRTPDGTTLAVQRLDGDGQLVVGLHGFTGNGTTMAGLVDVARGGRPALLIDCVGHGQSDAPTLIEPYLMNSVVDQMLFIVGDQPPGQVHLIGYSMGGRIALSMACRAPWYFASITTLSATPGIPDPLERAQRADADETLARRIEQDDIIAFVDDWLELPLFAPLVGSFDPAAAAADRAQRLTNTAVGLANSLRGTGTGTMPPVWDRLPGLRSPLLALAGALDLPYVERASAIAAAAPFGRSATIPAAGHALHIENPAVVAPLIAEFLEGCETDAAP